MVVLGVAAAHAALIVKNAVLRVVPSYKSFPLLETYNTFVAAPETPVAPEAPCKPVEPDAP